ncbi:MAG: hypothetical protein WBG37_21160 [Desulfobacterales bacterium]
MKYPSIKILALFIFLPPLLYLLTIHGVERVFTQRVTIEIEEISGGDSDALLNGSIRLQDAVVRNVRGYLKNNLFRKWGLRIEPTVATQRGRLLYPAYYDADNSSALLPDPMETARANFALLREGLTVSVTVKLNPLSPLALAILGIIGIAAGSALYLYLGAKTRRLRAEEEAQHRELEDLRQQEAASRGSLKILAADKSRLDQDLARVRAKLEAARTQASRNEDELFQEIDDLEQQLDENQRLQSRREAEIDELKLELQRLAKDQESVKRQKEKSADVLGKRFATLYKNLEINSRAISGLLALPEDMRIKAEEVVHQLNAAPEQITVKRKVFGKKGREPVLEVIFAYNGRLYFRNLKDNRREVVIIGNKNSQARDLEYVESVSRKGIR